MCGRFVQYSDPEIYARAFEIELDGGPADRVAEPPPPRYNLAPTQRVLAIRLDPKGRRRLVPLRWGLVPFWSKGPDNRYQMINARAETVAGKPAYRAAFRSRRCLIPSEGFYEWHSAGKTKQPYLIRREDRAPFAMAGLWEHWQGTAPAGGAGAVIESCTIIVTDANRAIRPLHERMPVILSPADHASWLDPGNADTDALLGLLRPAPDDGWTLEPVSREVNSPKNDDAALIEPIGDPGPPPAGQPEPHG